MQIKQLTILIFLLQANHYHTANSASRMPTTRTDTYNWTHRHFEEMVAAQKPSTLASLKKQIYREACRGITEGRKALPPALVASITAQDTDGLLTGTIDKYNAALNAWATKR